MWRPVVWAAAVAMSFGVAPTLMAAEYTFTPRLDFSLRGDDNLQVAVDARAIDAFYATLSPAMRVSFRGDRLEVVGNARLDFTRFDDVDFDTDDQFVDLTLRYGGETSLFQLDFNSRRQSQRTSEVFESGLLGGVERVESYSVRPSYVFALSDLYRVTLGASWRAQQYELTTFDDFKNYGFDVALSRQLDERRSVDLTVFGSEFETEDRLEALNPQFLCEILSETEAVFCLSSFNRTETTTLGVQLGYRHVLSEKSEFGLSIGTRQVEARDINREVVGCLIDTRFDPGLALLIAQAQGSCGFTGFDVDGAVDSSGLITRAYFDSTGEKTKLTASYERSVSPVGLGFLIETDRVESRFDYQFTPTMTWITRLSAQQTGAVASDVPFDREFYSINSSLNWRMREHWSLSPGVRWRRQEASFLSGSAQSISAFVELSYRPRGTRVSR